MAEGGRPCLNTASSHGRSSEPWAVRRIHPCVRRLLLTLSPRTALLRVLRRSVKAPTARAPAHVVRNGHRLDGSSRDVPEERAAPRACLVAGPQT
jgi:hypothetical protein